MKAQVTIEFALTFFIIFGLLVMLILITEDKISTIQERNYEDYAMVRCYHLSDFLISEYSSNPHEVNVSAIGSYVLSHGLFVKFENPVWSKNYGDLITGNKVSVRRWVIVNNTITSMDLVCRI